MSARRCSSSGWVGSFGHDALHGDARDLSFVMTAAGIGALTGAFGTARGGIFAAALARVPSLRDDNTARQPAAVATSLRVRQSP